MDEVATNARKRSSLSVDSPRLRGENVRDEGPDKPTSDISIDTFRIQNHKVIVIREEICISWANEGCAYIHHSPPPTFV